MSEIHKKYTTPEQSNRLLELGVPKWTADCFDGGFPIGIRVVPSPFFVPSDPCWSVGQLIDICLKCSTLEQRQVLFFCNGDDDNYDLMAYTINVLESGIMKNHMDFSKWNK